MNNDIKIMVELQGYCNKILKAKKSIEKNNGKKSKSEEEIVILKNEIDSLNTDVKNIKNSIKQNAYSVLWL